MPNLFSFRGRLNRAPFWWIKISLALLNGAAHLAVAQSLPRGLPLQQQWHAVGPWPLVFLGVLGVVVFWIWLATGIKRWHDQDKSGWWMLILLIPVVGAVWYLIACGFRPGTAGPNRFGPDPLAGDMLTPPR